MFIVSCSAKANKTFLFKLFIKLTVFIFETKAAVETGRDVNIYIKVFKFKINAVTKC